MAEKTCVHGNPVGNSTCLDRISVAQGRRFPWPIYMFFEMRFDLGTLDSGERLLPFWLLVLFKVVKKVLCTIILITFPGIETS